MDHARKRVHAPRIRFALHQLGQFLAGSSALPRLMYDSINLFSIPLSAQMVASYDTGFPQSQAAWDRFKGKPEIHIVQHSGVYTEGDVLDIERGAATVYDAHPFIKARKAAGYFRPSIYCSLNTIPQVRYWTKEFRLGVDYDLWVAHWTGVPHLAYPGSIGTQYASGSQLKKHYDLSVIYDAGWPHRTAPGPFRHVADGKSSLAAVAKLRSTTPAHIAALTGRHANDADLTTFAEYLLRGVSRGDVVAALAPLVAQDGATADKMPKGTVYYTTNR